MNNNQAKRDLMLQFVRYRSDQFEGMHVNRSHCPKIANSEELQYLLKKGVVVRRRVVASSKTSYTVLRPADGVTQSHRPVCKLCKGKVESVLGSAGHKPGCAGIIESVVPSNPSFTEMLRHRRSVRLQHQRIAAMRAKLGAA